MDRASDSGSEGWGFESLPVYQTNKRDTHPGIPLICFALRAGGTRKGGTSAHTGAKIESWRAIFSPWESPLYSRRIRYGCGWDINCPDFPKAKGDTGNLVKTHKRNHTLKEEAQRASSFRVRVFITDFREGIISCLSCRGGSPW